MQPADVQEYDGAKKVVLGRNQPEYKDLPALYVKSEGVFVTHWIPTMQEIEALLKGEHIELWTYTFGDQFPPTSVRVTGVHYEEDD